MLLFWVLGTFVKLWESLQHEPRQVSCVEKKQRGLGWVGMSVGRISGNLQGKENSVSQVNGKHRFGDCLH